MFVAGPPVVNALGREQLDRFALGGWEIQTRCGAIDHATEPPRRRCVRGDLGVSPLHSLPSSVFELPPKSEPSDDPERRDEFLFTVIPRNTRQVYKMRPIVEAVVRQGSFFEMGRMFGRGMITGAPARVDGVPVAVMASDLRSSTAARGPPMCCSTRLSALSTSPKLFHHCRCSICCDCPGFHIGLEAEGADDQEGRCRAMAAVNRRPPCRGAPFSCATCSARLANAVNVSRRAASRSAMLGSRRAGARCRWKRRDQEGRPIASRSTPHPTATPRSPRSTNACKSCATAVPRTAGRRSGSRKSSTRATPAVSRSTSPASPLRVAAAGRKQILYAAIKLYGRRFPRRR